MTVYSWQNASTEDIQHDMAMILADMNYDDYRTPEHVQSDLAFTEAMAQELRKRGAGLPINCTWVYNFYARARRSLTYDLEP